MKLTDLLLKKEELPILYGNCFQVPIHPRLLSPEVSIDKNIARDIFPGLKPDWHDDLKKYVETAELDNQTKEWFKDVFLKEFPDFWIPDVLTSENGFASSLCISRNGGGTLYFNSEDPNCQIAIPPNGGMYIEFSEEKAREFSSSQEDKDYIRMNIYGSHNVDYYPGALFLRNWAIAYENEVLKKVFG